MFATFFRYRSTEVSSGKVAEIRAASMYQLVTILGSETAINARDESVVRSTTRHKDGVSFLPPGADSYYIRLSLDSVSASYQNDDAPRALLVRRVEFPTAASSRAITLTYQ